MAKSGDFKFKAILVGCDARLPKDYKEEVFLRESKNFWIVSSGSKFRKINGWMVGVKFSTVRLDLTSVKPR